MAAVTVYLNLGSKSMSGQRKGKEGTAASADLTVTVDTAVVKTRGDFLHLCEQVASQLSGVLK